ncbi:uncharacterized protein LOC117645633 [Thrips palmi]|uniref:Uncharacterized protein LOC117645633 n=1 Tax=Thrips palmi TaxID=161013 RepID=A0A6P8YWA4_THRPL|nr:uncharacterized protein LOC117645633 [Thrips palmi]
MPTYAVVHWINEEKAGVTDIGNVLPPDRKEGKVTMVKHKKKRWPAKVIMLTDDKVKADERCTQLQFEIAAELKAKVATKRISKPSQPKGSAATQKQISSALNERCPVPSGQAKKKKEIDQSKKKDRQNQRAAEMVLDEKLSKDLEPGSAKKKLFEDDLVTEDESVPMTPNDQVSSEVLSHKSEPTCSKSDSKTHKEQVSSEENSQKSEPTCSKCHLLKKHGNAAIECFLSDLVKFFGMGLGERYKECPDNDQFYQLVLKPLPPGLKVVDLVKHHGVLVTKAGLSRILLSGGDDPRALVRAALTELYGRDQLMKMSGTKSLQKYVLDAIQSFVQSNTTEESRKKAKWSQSALVRTCNQMSSGLRHKSKSPSGSGKKSTKGRTSDSDDSDSHEPEEKDDDDDGSAADYASGSDEVTEKSDSGKGEKRELPADESNCTKKARLYVASPAKTLWEVSPIKIQPSQSGHRMVPFEGGRPSSNSSASVGHQWNQNQRQQDPPPAYNQLAPVPPAYNHLPPVPPVPPVSHHQHSTYIQGQHPGYNQFQQPVAPAQYVQYQQPIPQQQSYHQYDGYQYPPYHHLPPGSHGNQVTPRTPQKSPQKDASLGSILMDISNN